MHFRLVGVVWTGDGMATETEELLRVSGGAAAARMEQAGWR